MTSLPINRLALGILAALLMKRTVQGGIATSSTSGFALLSNVMSGITHVVEIGPIFGAKEYCLDPGRS